METKGKESSKDQCIIQYKTVSSEGDDFLVSPQSYDSRLTLLEAAKVRHHSPILEIAKLLEGNEVPKIFYYRKCRSLFTLKRDLETLKRKADESLTDEVTVLSVHLKSHAGDHHQKQGFTIQSVFFVARTSSKRDPSHEKCLHKVYN